MRAAHPDAQALELLDRHEHARVHAHQLRLQAHLVAQQLVEGGQVDGRSQREHEDERGHAGSGTRSMRPASSSVSTSPRGPSTPATTNTGV